jgi:hypothetical protein
VQNVVPGQADVVKDLAELGVQVGGLRLVGLRAGQAHVAGAVDRDPVVRHGEILGR